MNCSKYSFRFFLLSRATLHICIIKLFPKKYELLYIKQLKNEAGSATNFFFIYSTTASAISSAVIPAK